MHRYPTPSFSSFALIACLAGCSMAGAPGDDAGGVTDTTTATTTGEPTTNEPTTNDSPTTTDPSASDPTTTDPSTATDGEGSCGDGQRDPAELCDGADLGGKQCGDLDDAFIGGTLACAANCGSYDTSGCMIDPSAPLVALNELTSKGVVDGEYADLGDAIELHNAGGAAADISGWKLSDDPTFPADKTYVFPPGSTLAPGAFLVLVAYDADTMAGDLPFGLASDKVETLTLADASDEPRDTVTVDGAEATSSYCRLPDGTGEWQPCAQSFGAANIALPDLNCGDGVINGAEDCDGDDLAEQTCASLNLGFIGGTLACDPACSFDASGCISEGMAINELESGDDDIELYNAGNQAIDISGWILTDDLVDNDYDPRGDPEKLVFAAQTTLAAKQFLVIKKGENPGEHIFGLGASGDTVTLLRPNLAVVDQVSYGADEALESYCRLPDGPGGTWTVDCTPTLGTSNKAP